MSVYTTEVRYICEYEAGLIESTGYNDIDDIIEKYNLEPSNYIVDLLYEALIYESNNKRNA